MPLFAGQVNCHIRLIACSVYKRRGWEELPHNGEGEEIGNEGVDQGWSSATQINSTKKF